MIAPTRIDKVYHCVIPINTARDKVRVANKSHQLSLSVFPAEQPHAMIKVDYIVAQLVCEQVAGQTAEWITACSNTSGTHIDCHGDSHIAMSIALLGNLLFSAHLAH